LPQSCGKLVGENYAEWCPYIAPDESYMLFSAYTKKGEENNDLFIVLKDKQGNWSKAINIGIEVNTTYQEQFPSVSDDGKYLFFTSNRLRIYKKINHNYEYSEPLTYKKIRDIMNEPGNGKGDIYWVSAKIIEELKPKN
jgi:Tol biopolymer transport system component